MFERMEIFESIYEGVVEDKKPTRADANSAGHSMKKRGEAASSWNRPKKGGSTGKQRQRYVDNPTGKSKTFLIHILRHSSELCKVLGDFGTKYAKVRPTKYHGNIPVPRKVLTGRKKTTT